MLLDDFYTIISLDTETTSVKVVLEINPGHEIFQGHFPGMPVVPGVCMMQIVQEILEKVVGRPLLLSKADLMKFLVVIDPRVNKIVKVDLLYKSTEDGSINVTANLATDTIVCFKFKGSFVPRVLSA